MSSIRVILFDFIRVTEIRSEYKAFFLITKQLFAQAKKRSHMKNVDYLLR